MKMLMIQRVYVDINERFVQFNGGLTPKQLNWLKEQLTESKNRNEKVIIIGNLRSNFFIQVFFLT